MTNDISAGMLTDVRPASAGTEPAGDAPTPARRTPLTEEQLGLLVEHRANPAASPYNVPLAVDLRGPLDPAALDRALTALTRRHPMLSARVVDDGGLPELELLPGRRPPLERGDRPLGTDARATGCDSTMLLATARRELDLERDGVLRAVLLRHDERHHTLLLVIHHLVLDGESTGILLADLVAAYQHGELPTEGPAEFADYAAERAETAGREDHRALEAYWRERLSDADTVVDFPLDTPRPAESPGGNAADGAPREGLVSVEVDAALSAEISRFSREHRAGSASVLLAAYLKALATYARQQAPTVAVPLGVRGDLRFEETVGYFVRTLLVRCPDQGELTAADFVSRVQTELARAVDHSRLPFPRIARLLPGADRAAPDEAFNCTFVMHSWADPSASAEGLRLPNGLCVRWREDVPTPGLGLLTLELYEGEGRVRGRLKYDAARIAAGTAEAFTDHVLALAAQFVREPGRPVLELDGLSGRARATLDRLNATDHPIPDVDVDTLIRRRAADQPDLVAVEFGDRTWTYRQLDQHVDAYAAGLLSHGVRAGDLVGVMVPRTDEAVAVLLAVLRVGAAYVPIDPAHPEARRRHVVDSSGMRTVLVDATTEDLCPRGPDPVRVETLAVPRSLPTAAPSAGGPTADSALHVLYTSGSTGLPKGVQLSHRALATDVLAAVRHFDVKPSDAMLLKAPFTFDVSAHEMLVALVAGARLVVAPPDAERDPDLLAETLDRHGVTVLHLVPSQLRLLLDAEAFPANRTLRTVVSTGESLPNELRVAFEALHPARLHNAYGPTETSYSTVFSWPRGDDGLWTRRAEVPIGVPFDNIRCHVLDERQQPLPPGAPGELWIGGGTVSDGYLGDPERTADRYRLLDLGDNRPGPVYRTGDLVRLLPDGSLTHLGRLDDQVKINGNRVELGDVRAAVMAVAGVTDATVQVSRHAAGSLQLTAYLVPAELDVAAVRRELRRTLPSHMVPAHLSPVERIPLLPNGKTDRQELARIAAASGNHENAALQRAAQPPTEESPRPRTGEAPQPRAEETAPLRAGDAAPVRQADNARGVLPALRRVWAELLGSAADDAQFFEAGGDSILAMQLVSRMRREGHTLTIRDVYRNPVLADLADHLDAVAPPSTDTPARTAGPAPAPAGGRPLAPVQAWFFRHIRTDNHQWNQSVLLELKRPVEAAALRLALQAVVTAHPALSARFEPGDGSHGTGRMLDGAPFAAEPPREVLWERDYAGDRELDEVLEAVEGSLSPLDGVHVRAVLAHDRAGGGDLLLIAVHHLVVDGVSWRVLLEDLEQALDALADDALPVLPPEACGYGEWVDSLPAVAGRPGEAEYWLALAERRAAAHTLLLTTPAPDEQDIRRVEFSLDEEATQQLIGPLPKRLGLPVHHLMTGAFAQALARWRGTSTVTFDVETHGRHGRDDLFRTVGWFTAIHPVVVTAARVRDPEDFVSEAGRELSAVPEGGVGFGACREYSSDTRVRETLRELPPALVCFNYYGQADQLSPAGRFHMSGRPIPREHSAHCERVYGIEVYGIVHDGRLRMGMTWVPSPADGVDEDAVEALVAQLRWVLATLSGADPRNVLSTEITAPGQPAAERRRNRGAPAAPRRETVPVTAQQHGLLLDALAHQGTGRYVEQLHWRWHGPLDTERFTAAWHAVFRTEAVLRSAFDWQEAPRLVLHDHVRPEVTRLAHGDADWDALLESDRLRGFDLRRPGLLRATVLDDQPAPDGGTSARVLLTFHHVLLDGWSVSLLIQRFYRAYLAGGELPNGERRPDVRDYSRWLHAQETGPAREFWSEAIPEGPLAIRPGLPGEPTGQRGSGRAQTRLTSAEADRLRTWAATHAATESSALNTAWALLLSRLRGTPGPVRVGFGVTVSGRGIPLDGVEGLPGLLMNSLPMAVEVDPTSTVPALLAALRDRALDMASYEWVSTGQIHEWSGREAGERLVESLVVLENYPRSQDGLEAALAEHGVRVELPDAAGSETAFPVSLLAYRDMDGGLVLAAVHDRARLADADAARLVELCARLLVELPQRADDQTTVADVLETLPDSALPRMAERAEPEADRRSGQQWPKGVDVQPLVEAWQAVFGSRKVTAGDHFFEAGGHSLLAMKLLRELADRTGRNLRLDDLLSHPTAGQLAELLAAEPPESGGGVLVPLREGTDPDAGTVYLVHPPGGQVACYAQLARSYQGPERIVGIRDPRVDDSEPEHLTTTQLADLYLDSLRPALEAGQRVVLGGFSGGGVIAYEIAQQAAAEGWQPPLVVMVDAGAPDGELTDADADGSFAARLRAVAEGTTARPGHVAEPVETTEGRDSVAAKTTDTPAEEPADADAYLAELAQIADWMRGDGGGDPVALMADCVEAVQRYRPEPYPGPVTVLRAGDTGFGRGTEYDESDRYHGRPGLGWEDHCEDLAIRVVPGNHVTMMTGDNVRTLARVLAAAVRN
ncbi:amino acid adenylation domain-containing protein [Streptomyces durbertensis]|uniref:Amino acid adenylation domain-containing protein n=1 Tax=Streptomyces durbertensis TaxID=2448886 RepID=A0ABR6EGE1_9ACTN|nr:non-ribosomal peptide synthetase [Streptomyces durbertensis]MBB1244404.1 amino acid adenylation domain-containing protein [Streptomyces durbertensis]